MNSFIHSYYRPACPPKAEVRGSNPLGCANLFNNLAIYKKHLKALCSNCAPRGLKKIASIRKRGHRWEVRIRHRNKPSKCKTFTSKADALSWANKTEYLIETEAHTITPPTLSLSSATSRYVDEHMCRHKTLARNI